MTTTTTTTPMSARRRLLSLSAAAIAGNHPLDPGFTNSFTVVGREAEARTWPEISIRRVSPSYFETVGLHLLNGRSFRDSDTTAAPPVAVINAAAARQFFPGREPLGAHISFWGASRLIVGVVADERFHGVAEAGPIAAYTPIAQTPSANGAGVLLLSLLFWSSWGGPGYFTSRRRTYVEEGPAPGPPY